MKKSTAQSKHRFLCMTMALLLLCSAAAGCASKDEPLPGDVREAFLTVYGTYDYEGRYEALLKKDIGTVDKMTAAQEDYYASVRKYVSDEFYQTMLADREILKYEKIANENGYSYRADGFEFEEYARAGDETSYSSVAHMILTDAEGTEQSGTVQGQITVLNEDGKALISNLYLSSTSFAADGP